MQEKDFPDWRTMEGYRALSECVAREPENIEALRLFSKASKFRKKPQDALDALRSAMRYSPDSPSIRLELAQSLLTTNPRDASLSGVIDLEADLTEAESLFATLLTKPETQIDALIGLGQVDMRKGRFDDGVARFFQALDKGPEHAEKIWAPNLLSFSRKYPAVKTLRERTLGMDISPLTRMLLLYVPPMLVLKQEEYAEYFTQLEKNLDLLSGRRPEWGPFSLKMAGLFRNALIGDYAGYTAEAITRIKKKIARYFTENFPELTVVNPAVSGRLADPKAKKLRVGFVVTRCWNRDFASMFANLFSHIDTDRFQIVLLYNDPGLIENEYAVKLWELVDEKIIFPLRNWENYCRTVADANLDILLFENYTAVLSFSSFARLAPVQCVFLDWARPLLAPNEDYVLGVPTQRDSRLVQLSRPCFIPNSDKPHAVRGGKAKYGIPEKAQYILDFQALHRWMPDDDWILGRLLRSNPDVWLLARHDTWLNTKLVEYRWRNGALADVMDRVRFFNFEPHERLWGLMRDADLVLSPPRDTGTNSIATILDLDIPIAAAGYVGTNIIDRYYFAPMGIDGLTARDPEEFFSITNRLLNDVRWREEKSREIRENKHKAFDISRPVEELQTFFEGAYQRARSGKAPASFTDGAFIE